LQIYGSNGSEDWVSGLCNYKFIALAFLNSGIEASTNAGASWDFFFCL
jgi:hypothetical protein